MDIDASNQDLVNVYKHQITCLEKAIEELLPLAMGYYSEHYWAAGWLTDLEKLLPTLEPAIDNAARIIGKVPTTYEPKGEQDWIPYPSTYIKTVEGHQ
ncbi:hypothetical protein UFOVP629_60 [uncultured Caudovirales phage]|uniref:Uncharacterized protein n=1 Tax=uncultured Caudovirales phage TaxID=2100421 RepID=A0A6J5N5H1_9CAUD|nr:hypothetical protein UFOVP629_60 [uncultured Caudovirales phage]